MSPRSLSLFAAAALVAPAVLHAAPDASSEIAVRDIINRYAPALNAAITLETIPAEDGRDAYELESVGGRIVLRGNTGVAQCSAFYHYLKEYCRAHVSWNGDNLARIAAPAPAIPAKVRVVSPVKVRMAYNYCTHGYTMPFWDKAQWDREIDWLALHGINLALIIEGQEAVWQNTFTQYGYSKDEMRRWLCSPVHQPWQFMQNMQGVLPPPQSVIDGRTEVGRHIAARMRTLGMEPLLQGYYGMLPSGFAAKHPNAKIHPQGGWAGANKRPDMLNPGDPLFAQIAKTFHDEQRKIYGGDIRFLAADPFHEGGSSKGMDRGVVYKQVQDAILAFNPKATLVKQCWGASNKEMFDAGNRELTLALDLWCETKPFWKQGDAYSGTPWGWCFLYNFGGNLAIEGSPTKLVKDFGAAITDPGRKRLEAIAIVPEGSSTNPLMYELMTEMGWRGAPADTTAWVRNYIHARYGVTNADATAAWDLLLTTAYNTTGGQSPINSVLTARPSLNVNAKGRTWAPGTRPPYDNAKLVEAWGLLQKAAPALGATDTYRYDLADVARQSLTNLARPILGKIAAAAEAKDAAALRTHAARLRTLITDLDELTGTRRDWLMGAWVADARKWGKTPEEVAYMDRISRLILTTWVENPNTDLADYANREWNGLLGQYYGKRWDLFLDTLEAAVAAGKEPDLKAFAKKRADFETAWIGSNTPDMPAKPVGDTVAVCAKLHAKYAPLLPEYAGEPAAPLKKAKKK